MHHIGVCDIGVFPMGRKRRFSLLFFFFGVAQESRKTRCFRKLGRGIKTSKPKKKGKKKVTARAFSWR